MSDDETNRRHGNRRLHRRLDRQWRAYEQQGAKGVNDPGRYTRNQSPYTAWFTFDRHPILVTLAIEAAIVFAAFCFLVWMGVGYG